MKIAAIVFGALVLIFCAHTIWFYSAIGWDAVDDAYISYVYAHNAIVGHGLTFNPSERVEGFSNFLWTAMMVPIVGLGLDVGRISSALGVAFGVGVLVLAVRFPRWLGVPAPVGWIAALFLAVDGSFALWSVSGLETPMFAFLITLGAFLYVRENMATVVAGGAGSDSSQGTGGSQTRPYSDRAFSIFNGTIFPASGLVFALAAMTRPEAAAVFALTVAHQGAWRLLDQRKILTRTDILRIASFVALFVPYWLIRWRYYHSLLPNSFYAKVSVGGPIAQIMRGWEHVQQFVGVHLGWIILLPAVIVLGVVCVKYAQARWGVLRLRTGEGSDEPVGSGAPLRMYSRLGAAKGVDEVNSAGAPLRMTEQQSFFGMTYFVALILFYGAYIVYVGGDWSVGRFFVPMLAFVYLMIAAGIVYIVQFVIHTPQWARSVTIALAIVVALNLLYDSSYLGEYKIFIGGFDAALATQARITAGKWLKQNVPAGTWIAVDAAGQVPYFSELPTIDMFGINDLHIGRMPVANLGSGTPGHEKFDLGYIIARAPKYVVIYGTLFDTVTEYKRANVKWTDNPALEKFLTIYERVEGK